MKQRFQALSHTLAPVRHRRLQTALNKIEAVLQGQTSQHDTGQPLTLNLVPHLTQTDKDNFLALAAALTQHAKQEVTTLAPRAVSLHHFYEELEGNHRAYIQTRLIFSYQDRTSYVILDRSLPADEILTILADYLNLPYFPAQHHAVPSRQWLSSLGREPYTEIEDTSGLSVAQAHTLRAFSPYAPPTLTEGNPKLASSNDWLPKNTQDALLENTKPTYEQWYANKYPDLARMNIYKMEDVTEEHCDELRRLYPTKTATNTFEQWQIFIHQKLDEYYQEFKPPVDDNVPF